MANQNKSSDCHPETSLPLNKLMASVATSVFRFLIRYRLPSLSC